LVGCQADRAKDPEVSEAVAHGEQRDGDEGGDGNPEQDGVKRVDQRR
jgi:hypothetical protein